MYIVLCALCCLDHIYIVHVHVHVQCTLYNIDMYNTMYIHAGVQIVHGHVHIYIVHYRQFVLHVYVHVHVHVYVCYRIGFFAGIYFANEAHLWPFRGIYFCESL